MFLQVSVNGGLEADNAAEHTAFEPALGENGEKALDGIEPGSGCRGEVEREARMTPQPFDDLRVFAGGVVVEDHMDDLADRNIRLDLVKEANELLVPMPLHTLPAYPSSAQGERLKN